jgi:hypothetical protein
MRVRRLDVVDEYVEDGRAAVYTSQGMVLLLSELATSAWGALGAGWVSSAAIAEVLIQEFGDPGAGEAERLTEEALRSLAEMALVELDETAVADDVPTA